MGAVVSARDCQVILFTAAIYAAGKDGYSDSLVCSSSGACDRIYPFSEIDAGQHIADINDRICGIPGRSVGRTVNSDMPRMVGICVTEAEGQRKVLKRVTWRSISMYTPNSVLLVAGALYGECQ